MMAASTAGQASGIRKPLPCEQFDHHDTNAEMCWDSVDPAAELTTQERLFVRSHTSTPTIDATTYRLRIFGDGLSTPLSADEALTFSHHELRSLGEETFTGVFECTGNGRSFFATQQGRPAPGTQWRLGSVGAVQWIGVRLSRLLDTVGLDQQAVSIQAAGLDPHYVDEDGVDHGHVRRPLPVDKALADTFLAWGADGRDLLPDHGFPIRLVVPGWVGIASIKWLGSLEISTSELTSPWNTHWYRMTGPEHPADSPPLTHNPVRAAFELAWGATIASGPSVRLTGRAWSGVGPIAAVDVSTDGGTTWQPARLRDGDPAVWTRWTFDWEDPPRGEQVLLARATDVAGRTQPMVATPNDEGYFFDAVVQHPVRVV